MSKLKQDERTYPKSVTAGDVPRVAFTPVSGRLVAHAERVQVLIVAMIGPSLNTYDRMHWTKRDSLHDYWHQMVAREAKEQGLYPVQTYPVRVEVECYFGKGERRLDWDNLSPTPKLIQDGLVKAGILRNDSPPWVACGSMQSFKTKQQSYTLFKIHEPAPGE